MNCLLIDGLSNYSSNKNNFNSNTINEFYLFLSYLLKCNGHSVFYFDSREDFADFHNLENAISNNKISHVMMFVNNNKNHVWQIISRLGNKDIDYYLVSYIPIIINGLNSLTNVKTLVLQSKDISRCITEIMSFFNVSSLHNIKLDYSLSESLKNKDVKIYTSFEQREPDDCTLYHNYRKLEIVMEEIKNALMAGCKYFHVADLFFFNDIKYVIKFCKYLINLQREGYDYVWSCEISDKTVTNAAKISGILEESKLTRIVYLSTQRLPVNELISFIKKSGILIFSVVPYWKRNRAVKDLHSCSVELITLLLQTKVYVELFQLEDNDDTNRLIIKDISIRRRINNCFRLINDSLVSHRRKVINKYALRRIEKYYQLLRKYRIPLQIENELASGKKMLLDFKNNNEYVYSSWDIGNNITDYSIKTVMPIYINDKSIRNESERLVYDVLSYSCDGLTIEELLVKLNEGRSIAITISDIMQCVCPLEELGLVYFMKYLR